MPYFQFKVDDNIIYRTKVESLQCIETTKKGSRCKRRCVIGSPVCCTHLSYAYNLKIKPSNIPNAGKGLFAYDPLSGDPNEVLFNREETICQYKGEIIDKDELIRRYANKTAPFAIGVSANSFEDGARVRGIGSLANTNPGNNNATLSIYRGRASLKATKPIRNGEEIYLSYGREYKIHEPGVQSTTTTK